VLIEKNSHPTRILCVSHSSCTFDHCFQILIDRMKTITFSFFFTWCIGSLRSYSCLLGKTVVPGPPPRFLILPGFGNDKIDYINPLNQGEEIGFVQQLKSRGYDVDVVPVAVSFLVILYLVYCIHLTYNLFIDSRTYFSARRMAQHPTSLGFTWILHIHLQTGATILLLLQKYGQTITKYGRSKSWQTPTNPLGT